MTPARRGAVRLAVAVIVLADRDLVITDLGRALGDCDAWGLERLATSRHLPQADGYAHAMRHAGTADHLHVELR